MRFEIKRSYILFTNMFLYFKIKLSVIDFTSYILLAIISYAVNEYCFIKSTRDNNKIFQMVMVFTANRPVRIKIKIYTDTQLN